MITIRHAGALIAAVAIGCSSPAPTAPRPTAFPDAAGTGSGATPAAGVRGQACTPDEASIAGTCGDGLLCMPQAPGGYCLSFCGATGTLATCT